MPLTLDDGRRQPQVLLYRSGVFGGGRFGSSRSAEERPERPADKRVRRANLRRVFGLFRPYKKRLTFVLGLIALSSTLGVAPAFLLKGALEAIQAADTRLLSLYAGGMIAVAIATGA